MTYNVFAGTLNLAQSIMFNEDTGKPCVHVREFALVTCLPA